jgi:hypothetical protein
MVVARLDCHDVLAKSGSTSKKETAREKPAPFATLNQ